MQRVANRLVYGHRATPYEVLSHAAAADRSATGDREDALGAARQPCADPAGAAPARGEDALPGHLRDLLPPLERLAADLDRELRLWQTEPHRGLVFDAMPELRERGHTLIGQAMVVRTSALQGAVAVAGVGPPSAARRQVMRDFLGRDRRAGSADTREGVDIFVRMVLSG
jgi:hypothetical protein